MLDVLRLAPRRWALIGAIDAIAALLIGNWLVALILLGVFIAGVAVNARRLAR